MRGGELTSPLQVGCALQKRGEEADALFKRVSKTAICSVPCQNFIFRVNRGSGVHIRLSVSYSTE